MAIGELGWECANNLAQLRHGICRARGGTEARFLSSSLFCREKN